MSKFRTFLSSAFISVGILFGYSAIPALLPATAESAECTMYETLHPNFPLTGSHLSTGKCSTCASCHAGGIYLGTPKVCATCHNGNPIGQISSATIGRSNAHIPLGSFNDCEACHNTTSFTATWSMTHSAVGSQACSSCHNGSYTSYGAMGKDANHIVTTAECSTCHATMDKPTHTNADWFIPMNTIHNGITTGCVSCHDGTHAKGKSNYAPGHPNTSDQCETCHSINNSFKCASLFDSKPFLKMVSDRNLIKRITRG